jgi:hypothetical protein
MVSDGSSGHQAEIESFRLWVVEETSIYKILKLDYIKQMIRFGLLIAVDRLSVETDWRLKEYGLS